MRSLLRLLPLVLASFVSAQTPLPHNQLLQRYCVTCHSDAARTGGLSLAPLAAQVNDTSAISRGAETWEKVIRKIRAGSMPPQTAPRPDAESLNKFASYLENTLDQNAAAHPYPGSPGMHRLNRTEYANAIRDLLAVDIDASALLPADDESNGFDNISDALRVSPSLMERYLSASWNISRLAVGNTKVTPTTATYRVRPDLSQDQHIEGLPPGTRGGILVKHNFPVDGEYVIKARLWRNTFDLMRGMEDPHEIEIAVDKQRVRTITVGGREDFARMAENPGNFGADLDQRLSVRLPLVAGPHTIHATAVLRSNSYREDLIQPFLRTTVDGLDITGDPSIDRLNIEGPYETKGVSETPSRRKIFLCKPATAAAELPCARQVLSSLAQRAYRRPVKDRDIEPLLSFYQRARNNKKSFDAGIESALQLILASPEFLFRMEENPANVAVDTPFRIGDLALASRLSFFLWSSAPDETLINLATAGKLKDSAVLEQQVRRMLASPKAVALVDNFAEQWLFLRNLKSSSPNLENFPDFDDNLRQAMREETKRFIDSVIRENRSAMDLLNADYTFVNERLARHYGIPNIYGSQFRRVAVTDPNRRGLLGQASILTVTSYPNRTSPVQRGKWILTNLLGIPPQPPPPNVPALKDNEEGGRTVSLRERMEAHRANAVCAGCHKVMDPVGFALENFDGTGRWRTQDDGAAIDPSGVMFNGTTVAGPAQMREMLSKRPEVFVGVLTERLLTYALGRGLDYRDMPAVRKILKDTAADNFRMGSLIMSVVKSVPFQMKVKAAPAETVASIR